MTKQLETKVKRLNFYFLLTEKTTKGLNSFLCYIIMTDEKLIKCGYFNGVFSTSITDVIVVLTERIQNDYFGVVDGFALLVPSGSLVKSYMVNATQIISIKFPDGRRRSFKLRRRDQYSLDCLFSISNDDADVFFNTWTYPDWEHGVRQPQPFQY